MVMLMSSIIPPGPQLIIETLQCLSTKSFSIESVAVANDIVGIQRGRDVLERSLAGTVLS
jgi:hypothetical protein